MYRGAGGNILRYFINKAAFFLLRNPKAYLKNKK